MRRALVAAALALAIPCSAAAAPVRGPDYSNNNGCGISVHKVRADGARFIGLKATEGLGFRDRCFPVYWGQAQHEGLIRIAYDFTRPRPGSGRAEARAFVHYVNQYGFTRHDLAVADVEDTGAHLSVAQYRQWVSDWTDETFADLHPARTGVYSGNWYWASRLGCWFPAGAFSWVANYSPAPIPFGCAGWDLWQYTDGPHGLAPHGFAGVRSDVSIFSGDYARLKLLAGIIEQHTYASRTLKRGRRGTDVTGLQGALNHRLVARRRHPLGLDGSYGARTGQAVKFVKWRLGFKRRDVRHPYCTARCQVLLAHPNKRPSSYLSRAHQRRP